MPRWLSFDAFLTDTTLAVNDAARQALVDELLEERPVTPWIEDDKAVFLYAGSADRAALNLDTISADPPFLPMERVEGTNLWYVAHRFERDDLLDYLLAIDDPMTPTRGDANLASRVASFWRPDPRNPLRLEAGGTSVSVLRMKDARAFADWSAFKSVVRGRTAQHSIDSEELGFKGRTLWVYTPPGYARIANADQRYPLLLLHDGQWAAGALQAAALADALIKNERVQPCVIAMIQSGAGMEREREYAANERHYQFLLTELLPYIQTRYRIDPARTAIGGVAVGALAAAHAALTNPSVFSAALLISPPLGKSGGQEPVRDLLRMIEAAESFPKRIFQSVGRYEARGRFIRPAFMLRDALMVERQIAYRFAETGSGHSLVGFKSVLPEALAWMFPGSAASAPR